ncbi:nuclear transport factor 2 family protein [Denitromonas ohlonensis]|uniref:Nuclear transport factor 2 family protein n=2 Tax=Denitromonas TaxID=139331 RepID=A0A557SP32_9RHOO|nr:nuclear transport factor 2 family protein [Denitromonas ohlonensis]TVO67032.1 nuclear transport factor 2 family protein [Denitromonas ohlonensis]TVO79092.1 nuclear transport factor 2 family protein [Denitromonas ohlonensis]
MTDDTAAITELLQKYYDALVRCDTALLAEVLHPEAHYFTASDGTLLHLDMPTYFPIVAGRTSPDSTGEACRYTIDSIELIGPVTALARMRSTMMQKHFNDILSLIRLDGQWRIIAKVFHFDPATPTGAR